MKENFLGLGKWIVVGTVLVAIGCLLAVGMGRKRGTRSYRWRMAMWSLVIGLVGGGAIFVSSCSSIGKPMCYDPIAPPMEDTGTGGDDFTAPDAAPQDTPQEEEQRVLCYAPRLPDEVEQPPADAVMCYFQVPPDTVDEPDLPVLCYAEMLPDVTTDPPDTADEPDVFVTCYKMIPDIVGEDQETPDAQHKTDATQLDPDMMMCYFAGDPPE